MKRTKRDGIEYGGSASKYYWDKNVNPNADIENGLPDCTTYVYGRILEDGKPAPVKKITAGGYWHKSLINNWTYLDYDVNQVQAGDLIEWQTHNHIAYVEEVINGVPYISGSFYTGMHGKARYNGKYDTRDFSSLQELNDYMLENYEYRYFHYVPVTTESKWCSGQPEFIVRYKGAKPASPVTPVDKDISKNQIQIITNEQNVRDGANNILGIASSGHYNVISTKKSGGYTWYQVETNKWIAGIKGRVIYIPKQGADPNKPTFVKNKQYTLQFTCIVREGPGTSYASKKKSQLTPDGKKHANAAGNLLKGTKITCLDSKDDKLGNVWVQCPSGWVVGYWNKEIIIK